MITTATSLRADLYRLLDQVIATGEPLTIRRGDREIEIRAKPPAGNKLDRLVPIPGLLANPDEIPASPWDEEAWKAKWKKRLG